MSHFPKSRKQVRTFLQQKGKKCDEKTATAQASGRKGKRSAKGSMGSSPPEECKKKRQGSCNNKKET